MKTKDKFLLVQVLQLYTDVLRIVSVFVIVSVWVDLRHTAVFIYCKPQGELTYSS